MQLRTLARTTSTRRRVLATGGLAVLGTTLVGCDALSTEPEDGEDERGTEVDTKEAPSLAETVKSGDLPPLADRLPTEPLVGEPHDQLGSYGGTWRAALIGTTPFWLIRSLGYENLMRWDPGIKSVLPNVAKEATVNDDGTQYTFVLREGMRWSDGEPFTVDDIMFWYDSVLTNPSSPRPVRRAGCRPAARPSWSRKSTS